MDYMNLRPVQDDQIRQDVWEGRSTLTSLVPVGSTPFMKFGGSELMSKLGEARIWERENATDILGESAKAIARTGIQFTGSLAANVKNVIEDVQLGVYSKQAEGIRKKREKEGYDDRYDPFYMSDSAVLKFVDSRQDIELDGVMIDKYRNDAEKWSIDIQKYIHKNLPQREGAVNEWTNRIVGGTASTAVMVGAFMFGEAAIGARLGGSLLSGSYIGAVAGGEAYAEAERMDASLSKKLRLFAEVGGSEALFEAIGMDFIARSLKGSRMVSRVAIAVSSNAGQEFSQGLSEGAWMKFEGIRPDTWSSIVKEAAKDAVAGAFSAAPYAGMQYRAENKSVLGEFRRMGLSDEQTEMVLDDLMSLSDKDISIKGDIEKALMQKGIPETEARLAEQVVNDFNLRAAVKDSSFKKIFDEMSNRGASPAVAFEIAESTANALWKASRNEVMKFVGQRAKAMSDLAADEHIRMAVLSRLWKNKKPKGMSEEEWLIGAKNFADVTVKSYMKAAEDKGMDPIEYFNAYPVDFRTKRLKDAKVGGLLQRGKKPRAITIEDLKKSGEDIPPEKMENAERMLGALNALQEAFGKALIRGDEYIAKGGANTPFNSFYRSQERQDAMRKELNPDGTRRYPTATEISIHTSGLAVDIPTKSLQFTAEDKQRLAELAHSMGLLVEKFEPDTMYEGTPGHLHIEIPSDMSQLEKAGILQEFKNDRTLSQQGSVPSFDGTRPEDFATAEDYVTSMESNWSNIKTGKPLEVKAYHGSPDARFAEEFDPNKKGYYPENKEALPNNKEFEDLYGKIRGGFNSRSVTGNIGVSFSRSPQVARSYANKPAFDYQNSVPMVLERYITLENPKVFDFHGGNWNLAMEKEIRTAISEGHDGLVFRNIKDDYHVPNSKIATDNVIVLDVKNIKTRSQLIAEWNAAQKGRTLFQQGMDYDKSGNIRQNDNFNKWFGDSKVVDNEGAPIIVYHGSPEMFEVLLPNKTGQGSDQEGAGFYFTNDKEEAGQYIQPRGGRSSVSEKGQVIAGYLRIKRPVPISGKVKRNEIEKLVLKSIGLNKKSEISDWYDNNEDAYWDSALSDWGEDPISAFNELVTTIMSSYPNEPHQAFMQVWADAFRYKNEAYMKAMLELGYDGVIVKKESKHAGNDHYVLFDPNGFKSINNIGEYSSDNNNFYLQYGKSSAPRAMIDLDERMITLFEKADVTSLAHEFAHLWLNDQWTALKEGGMDDEQKAYFRPTLEWMGVKEGQGTVTTAQHEQFAEGFERYLAEGYAPFRSDLGDAFRAFRNYMLKAYISVSNIGKPLNGAVRDYFGRMLGADRALTEEEAQMVDEDFIEAINFEMDSEVRYYDGTKEVDEEDLKEAMTQLTDDELRTVELAYLAWEDLAFMARVNKYVRNKFSKEYIERTFDKDYWAVVRWVTGKKGQGVSADKLLDEFDQMFPGELQRNIEGKVELNDFNDWLFNYLVTHADRVNADKEALAKERDINRKYADIVRSSKERAAKARKDKRVNDKSIAVEQAKEAKRLRKALRKDAERRKKMDEFARTYVRAYEVGFKKGQAPIPALESMIEKLRTRQATISQLHKDMVKLIDGLDIDASSKNEFKRSVYNIKTEKQFNRLKASIEERLHNKTVKSLKDKLEKNIKKELEGTKNVRKGTRAFGRYDYESNKLFDEFRRIHGMSVEESLAEELLSSLDKNTPLSETELMIRRMRSLRAGGRGSSLALYSQVLGDIKRARMMGELAKNEEDFFRRIERKEYIDEALAGLDKIQADKDSIKTKILNIYRSGFSNQFSMFNSIFGRRVAKKWDPELLESRRNTASYQNTQRYVSRSAEMLGLDEHGFINWLSDMAKEQWRLEANDGIVYDISKMDVLHLYNSSKNEHTREQLERVYGEQVQGFISELSDKEKAVADYWMEEVQGFKNVFNDHAISITGRDMGEVENYWPRVSRVQPDVFDDMKVQSNIPSAEKSRSGGAIKPLPANAWTVLQKHMHQAEHVRWLSRRHEQLRRLLTDEHIENGIKRKYGKEIYADMLKQVELISLNYRSQQLSLLEKGMGTFINNWVAAKVALNPAVFVKQLVSIGNYIEDMPADKWGQYFLEGISDPKKTFDFMWENADFLEARFNRGYSEALKRAMDGASEMENSKNDMMKTLTSLVRTGDITAIIYGGYPLVKHIMEQNGGDLADAIDKFEAATLKAQQSSTSSGLSLYQNNATNPVARILLAFKNTANQYMRKQVDALISYHNGDITKEELTKVLMTYSVVQPALYSFAGMAINKLYSTLGWLMFGVEDDDDDQNLFVDMLTTIAASPFNAIPILDGLSRYAMRKISGQKAWKVFSFPLFDDLAESVQKMGKKKKTFWDLIDIIAGFQEPIVPIPTKTGARILKKITGAGKKKGKSGKIGRSGTRRGARGSGRARSTRR